MTKPNANKTGADAPPVVRTSAGLRDILFDEIDAMRAGSSNPTRGNAVARLVTGVVEVVNMEMEVSKFAMVAAKSGLSESGPALPRPIPLGGERAA